MTMRPRDPVKAHTLIINVIAKPNDLERSNIYQAV